MKLNDKVSKRSGLWHKLAPIDQAHLESIPGFVHAKVYPGVNAYPGMCEVCRKRVEAGAGARITVRGPFGWIHKVRHQECKEGELFINGGQSENK